MSTPFYDLASLVLVPSGYKAQKVYAQKPLTTDGQLSFSRASTATRVNASGALETVSSNVPRLDYTNSTCPKLLLEPQRTQKLTGSNTFTNLYWTLASQGLGSAPVLTANYGTDPFGGNNAWRIQLNLNGGTDSSSRSWFLQAFNPSATVTLSMYIKLNTAGTKTVVLSDSAGHTVSLNSTSWTRISQTVIGGSGEFRFGLIGGGTSDTLDASICYAQCEEGSYPTSIIVSTNAAVTRLADTMSKTLVNSNSNFSLFLELDEAPLANASGDWLALAPSNAFGRAFMYSNSFGFADAYGAAASVVAQRKFAWTQISSTTAKVFSNGVLRSTGTGGSYSNPFNLFSINGSFLEKPVRIKQLMFFDAPITDAQAIELTAL